MCNLSILKRESAKLVIRDLESFLTEITGLSTFNQGGKKYV